LLLLLLVVVLPSLGMPCSTLLLLLLLLLLWPLPLGGEKRSGAGEEHMQKKTVLGVQEWLKMEKMGLEEADSQCDYVGASEMLSSLEQGNEGLGNEEEELNRKDRNGMMDPPIPIPVRDRAS